MENSVNLYKGTVVYDQMFCTLSGREEHDGLEVSLSVCYEDGAKRFKADRNLESSTGILGLNWTLKTNYIKLDRQSSNAPENRQYILSYEGIYSRLIRQENELLFTIPASVCADFLQGMPVPDFVRELFLSFGMPLSKSACFKSGE